MTSSTSVSCLNDDGFGPAVRGCRDDFDFTQGFEKIFLTAVPAAIFIVVAAGRMFHLAHKPRLVFSTSFQLVKIIAIAIYVAFQLSLLLVIASSKDATPVLSSSIAGMTLAFFAGLVMIALSFLEHARSRRTSALLNVYLLLTLLFDVAQARTLWLTALNPRQNIVTRLFTASIGIKVVVLLLEAHGKSTWIRWDDGEHSPEEASGIYSLSVLFWLKKLFLSGYKGILSWDDLYGLDKAMSADVAGARLMQKFPKSGDLTRSLFRNFFWELSLPVLPSLALIAFQFSQTFFLQSMIRYLEMPKRETSKNRGYGLIGACALIYLGLTISTSYKGYYTARAVSTIRACLCAAIYQKTIAITTADAADGASITLMSTDVQHVSNGIRDIHGAWSSLLKVGLGCWLLYTRLGAALAAPIVIIIICTGFLAWTMTLVQNRQAVWMEKIQTRVGMTAHAIAHMKYFKMLGISDHIAELINGLRAQEITAGSKVRVIWLAAFALAAIPASIGPVVTFALTARTLDTSTLFVSLSLIALFTEPLSSLFQDIPTILAARTSLGRIEAFLVKLPRQDFRKGQIRHDYDSSNTSSRETWSPRSEAILLRDLSFVGGEQRPAFIITRGSFGWEEGKMVVQDVDVTLQRSQISIIVGPIASGKSTLCKALLGEVPFATGSTHVCLPEDAVSYCAQTPFLSDATLKENIVGHSIFDQIEYDSVISATLLNTDVDILPLGHDTKIGSNGIILSGGQKQRVSLARALYRRSDVMVFDDVFSGLDATTEAEVFRRVFGRDGLIRRWKTTAVICTHSVHHLPSADHIVALGSDGKVVEQGTFDELRTNGKYVSNLNITSDGTASRTHTSNAADAERTSPQKAKAATEAAVVDPSRQVGDWSVYKHYFDSINTVALIIFLGLGVIYGTVLNFGSVWVSYWSADAFGKDKSFYVGLYGLIRSIEVTTLVICGAIGFTIIISSSGLRLHNSAIKTVVTAPLSLFTATDTGTVTNLFSQDLNLIDDDLPFSLLNTYSALVSLIGNFFVAAIASPYLAISYPFLMAILYGIQMFYLRTSRQLRLLDLEAKSPLYNHFLDTITGLATIRAFAWVQDEITQNKKLINASQRPAYLLSMIQQWLYTKLNYSGASLLTLINLTGGIAGLMQSYTGLETSIGAVNRLRTFGRVTKSEDEHDVVVEVPEHWPSRGTVTLDAVSASYSRVNDRQRDTELGTKSDETLALNNLSFSIRAGEKVAICGRTGSGKSSLMLLLLRLLDPLAAHENIQIDGIPLSSVHRSILRQRIIAVPQDSVFLPGKTTIRLNIDPLGAATDEECRAALETVHLMGFVEELGGLDADMSAESLSAGQQQLFGLGRAVLRRRTRGGDGGASGGILLLDEMNSKLDKDTDRLTQDIVRREFRRYTVIMVAHRLDMVMNLCDRVLILDKGALVEEGNPKVLASIEGSWFGELKKESA